MIICKHPETIERNERRKKAWSIELQIKLKELYIDQGMTAEEVGLVLGYTKTSINTMLSTLGINRKGKKETITHDTQRKYDIRECRKLDRTISCRKCAARRECMGE